MSDELKQAMDTIAAQSETIAETTQAFTDLTRMTLNLAMGVRAATPRQEMLEALIELVKGSLLYVVEQGDAEEIDLCKEMLAWLDLFKRDGE